MNAKQSTCTHTGAKSPSLKVPSALESPVCVRWFGEAAHRAPREANCPLAFSPFASHSPCALLSLSSPL